MYGVLQFDADPLPHSICIVSVYNAGQGIDWVAVQENIQLPNEKSTVTWMGRIGLHHGRNKNKGQVELCDVAVPLQLHIPV